MDLSARTINVNPARKAERAGRATVGKMGHKTIVVQMWLAGTGTQEITRRIYHSPEAVDQYLKTFDRLLVLRHFGLPKKLMVQVTRHSLSLIEEHLDIADKHFPTAEALTQYLTSRGVDLEEAG